MDEVLYWVCTKRPPCLMTYDKQTQKNTSLTCLTSKSDSAINCDNVPITPKKKNKRKLTILDEDSVTPEKPNNVYFEVPKNTEENPVLANTKTNVHTVCVKKCKPCPSNKRQKLQNGVEKKTKANTLATSTPKISVPPQIRRSPRVAKNKSKNLETHNLDESQWSSGKLHGDSNLALRPRKLYVYKEGGDQKLLPKSNKKDLQPVQVEDDDISDVSGFTANYIRSTKVDPKKCDKKKLMTASWRKVGKVEEQVIVSYNKATNAAQNKHNKDEQSLSSFNVVNVITMPNTIKSDTAMKLIKPPCLKSNVAACPTPDKRVSTRRSVKKHTCTKTHNRCDCSIPRPYGGSSSSANFVNIPEEWNPHTEVGVRTRSKGGLALQRKTPDGASSLTTEESDVIKNTVSKNKNIQNSKTKNKTRKQNTKNIAACLRKDCLEPCPCNAAKNAHGRSTNKRLTKDDKQVPSCSKCSHKHVTIKVPNISSSLSLTVDDDKKSMEKSNSAVFCIHIDSKSPGRKCCLPSGTYVKRESPERRQQEQQIFATQAETPLKNCKICMEKNTCICGPMKCDCLASNVTCKKHNCSAYIGEQELNNTTMCTRRQSGAQKRLSNKRESLRNKSGFTACFSDSGCSDCEEQNHSKKFFC